MAFCEQCGTKFTDGEQFCSGCGKKVSAEQVAPQQNEVQASVPVTAPPVNTVLRICSVCKKELEQDWIVCPFCKTAETGPRLCVKCKKGLKDDWVVCPFCNTAV